MKIKNIVKKGGLSLLLLLVLTSAVFAVDTYSLTLKLKKGAGDISGLSNITQSMYLIPGAWTTNDIMEKIVVKLYQNNQVDPLAATSLTLSKVGTKKYDPPIPFQFTFNGADLAVVTPMGNVACGSGLELDINGLELGKRMCPVLVSNSYYVILSIYAIPSDIGVFGTKVGETWSLSGAQKKAGPPPAPVITNTIPAVPPAVYPAVRAENISSDNVYIELQYDPNYEYSELVWNVKPLSGNYGADKADPNKPVQRTIGKIAPPASQYFYMLEPDKTYEMVTRGKNIFGPNNVAVNIYNFTTKPQDAGGVVSLVPGTITLRNGINFISMPFNRKGAEIQWYAYDATIGLLPPYPSVKFKNGQNIITTPRDLVDCINKLSEMQPGGPSKVVSTFGRWVEDGQPGQTSDKGLLFKDKDPNVLVKGDWNNISINELKAENGYQVYISGLTKDIVLQITNTPPGPGQ